MSQPKMMSQMLVPAAATASTKYWAMMRFPRHKPSISGAPTLTTLMPFSVKNVSKSVAGSYPRTPLFIMPDSEYFVMIVMWITLSIPDTGVVCVLHCADVRGMQHALQASNSVSTRGLWFSGPHGHFPARHPCYSHGRPGLAEILSTQNRDGRPSSGRPSPSQGFPQTPPPRAHALRVLAEVCQTWSCQKLSLPLLSHPSPPPSPILAFVHPTLELTSLSSL